MLRGLITSTTQSLLHEVGVLYHNTSLNVCDLANQDGMRCVQQIKAHENVEETIFYL